MNGAAARPFPRRRRWDAGLRSPSRLTAASAPCYIGVPRFPPRVGGVRLPRGRVTKEPKRRVGRVTSVRQPRVGGWWWIGCDDASALLPGINAASTGAFAFTDESFKHLGRDDAFHRGLVIFPNSTAAPLCRGKRAIEGKSPMESVDINTRCLSGERECSQRGEKDIYPERCDGRLSSSSARHRRRVIHPPDPPRAVDVAPEPPSASSSSSHASSSSAAAQAPDGPVALLPSVVIRELGVDHRLETARRERRGQGE